MTEGGQFNKLELLKNIVLKQSLRVTSETFRRSEKVGSISIDIEIDFDIDTVIVIVTMI